MGEWVVCVVLSSVVGSLLYGAWLLFARSSRQDIYARKVSLNYVVVIFAALAFGSLAVSRYVSLTPGADSWLLVTKGILRVYRILSVIWIVGAVGKLMLYLTRFDKRRRLAESYFPCDARTTALLRATCETMGIRARIRIVQSYAVPTAKIEGLLHPQICIPGGEYGEEAARTILIHELIHYVNHDRWIRECAIVLECLHWFNPVIRHMHRSLEQWDEYYCDYCVCHRYHISETAYMTTLVEMADRLLTWREELRRTSVAELGFLEDGRDLEKRIAMLLNVGEQKRTKGTAVAACVSLTLFGAILCAGTGLGMEQIHEKWILQTMDGTMEQEEYVEETMAEGQEREIPPEEAPDMAAILAESESVATETMVQFTRVFADGVWPIGMFQATEQQEIFLSIVADPGDVELKIGIVEPDGTWRYIDGTKNVHHTFIMDQTGTYVVFVENGTAVNLDVIGFYVVKDPSQ